MWSISQRVSEWHRLKLGRTRPDCFVVSVSAACVLIIDVGRGRVKHMTHDASKLISAVLIKAVDTRKRYPS